MKRMRRFAWVLSASTSLLTGCYSFSSYQTARLVPRDVVELTPSVSRFQPTFENTNRDFHWQGGDWTLDLQARGGINSRVGVGVKLSRIFLDDGYEFIAIDPKVALLPDHVAVSLPVGTFFGNGVDSHLQLHPTLFLSTPIAGGRHEATVSGKALIVDNGESFNTAWGFTAGVRFHSADDRMALQPEVGVLLDPNDERTSFFQFGIAVTVRTDRRIHGSAP